MSFTVTDEPVYIDLTLSENKEEVNGSIFENLFLDFTYIFKMSFDDLMNREGGGERMKYNKKSS